MKIESFINNDFREVGNVKVSLRGCKEIMFYREVFIGKEIIVTIFIDFFV